MEENSFISLQDLSTAVRFEWTDFDGDDCFNSFQIVVKRDNQSHKFDFGACAIFGLRELSKFFSDTGLEIAGLGFRNPDIRYCRIFRDGRGYRLVIEYEGNNLRREFNLFNPAVKVDDAFLKFYEKG